MGGYTEITAPWQVLENANGLTAVRVFHDANASGPDDLPEVGDAFDSTVSEHQTLLAVSRLKQKFGGHPDKHLWTINYSNNPQQGDGAGGGTACLPQWARLGYFGP
jgi:hypothetical protein